MMNRWGHLSAIRHALPQRIRHRVVRVPAGAVLSKPSSIYLLKFLNHLWLLLVSGRRKVDFRADFAVA